MLSIVEKKRKKIIEALKKVSEKMASRDKTDKTMTGEKKDGVNVKPEMINRGSGGIKSTTT